MTSLATRLLLCLLPNNQIKEKLLDLIESTFKRALKTLVHFTLPVMTGRFYSLSLTKVDIHFGYVRMYATPYYISWIIHILDLEPSSTDTLLEFRSVQIEPLSKLTFLYCYERDFM